MKRTFFKNISLVVALVVVVYLVANYSGLVQTTLLQLLNIPGSSVKGASTQRAQELSEKFKSDLRDQFAILQEQALNLTLGDAINGIYRLQKIPKDIHTLQEFTKEQIDDMLKSKK